MRAVHIWRQASLGLAAAGLALILLFTLVEIVARALGAPTRWALDGSSYLFCLMIGTVLPIVTLERSHASIDLVGGALRPRPAARLRRGLDLLAGLACLAAGWLLAGVVLTQYDRGLTTLTALIVPKWPLTAALLYGFGASAVIYFGRAAFSRSAA